MTWKTGDAAAAAADDDAIQDSAFKPAGQTH